MSDTVKCPECGASFGDLWDYSVKEGDNEIHCPHCDKAIVLNLMISHDYETRRVEP